MPIQVVQYYIETYPSDGRAVLCGDDALLFTGCDYRRDTELPGLRAWHEVVHYQWNNAREIGISIEKVKM